MRLIDADALELDAAYDDGEYWAYSWIQIKNAPTIDPVRKTGIWKNRSLNILYPEWERYECSVCGGYSYIHKYCPNCGAKMEGCEQNG